MANMITIIISVAAFAFSIIQFFNNHDRNKKEATLNAYKALQSEFEVIKKMEDNLPDKNTMPNEWQAITKCLANIENFCVGINTGIYDIKILNRLGGGFFINRFELLKPVIQEKQENSTVKIYGEYEETINKLKKLRNQ